MVIRSIVDWVNIFAIFNPLINVNDSLNNKYAKNEYEALLR